MPEGPKTVDRSRFFNLGVDELEEAGVEGLDEEVHGELDRDEPDAGDVSSRRILIYLRPSFPKNGGPR